MNRIELKRLQQSADHDRQRHCINATVHAVLVAQYFTRSSATAEKQRVSCAYMFFINATVHAVLVAQRFKML